MDFERHPVVKAVRRFDFNALDQVVVAEQGEYVCVQAASGAQATSMAEADGLAKLMTPATSVLMTESLIAASVTW